MEKPRTELTVLTFHYPIHSFPPSVNSSSIGSCKLFPGVRPFPLYYLFIIMFPETLNGFFRFGGATFGIASLQEGRLRLATQCEEKGSIALNVLSFDSEA